jgi:hypothetical protein
LDKRGRRVVTKEATKEVAVLAAESVHVKEPEVKEEPKVEAKEEVKEEVPQPA